MGVKMRYGSGGTFGGGSGGSGGGVQMTRLWTNASPSSSFAAQEVAVDLTGYDLYAVQVRLSTTQDVRYGMRFFPVDESTNQLECPQHTVNRTAGRNCTYSLTTKKLSFDGAYYNASANNKIAIPLYIWGIKL